MQSLACVIVYGRLLTCRKINIFDIVAVHSQMSSTLPTAGKSHRLHKAAQMEWIVKYLTLQWTDKWEFDKYLTLTSGEDKNINYYAPT